MDIATESPYPATTKHASRAIRGIPTEAMAVFFADKILVTLTQDGRLAQWFHVPIDQAHQVIMEARTADDDLLPLPHLTPRTLLGGTVPEREHAGQLVAVQIASAIAGRNKEETRMIVVGLGLKEKELDQESFVELLELSAGCL